MTAYAPSPHQTQNVNELAAQQLPVSIRETLAEERRSIESQSPKSDREEHERKTPHL
jgi:hypothetical protein